VVPVRAGEDERGARVDDGAAETLVEHLDGHAPFDEMRVGDGLFG
jgi:hypothetical protein